MQVFVAAETRDTPFVTSDKVNNSTFYFQNNLNTQEIFKKKEGGKKGSRCHCKFHESHAGAPWGGECALSFSFGKKKVLLYGMQQKKVKCGLCVGFTMNICADKYVMLRYVTPPPNRMRELLSYVTWTQIIKVMYIRLGLVRLG